MTHIKVYSEDWSREATVINRSGPAEDPDWHWTCNFGHEGTDRGNFEDTVNDADGHLEFRCAEGLS